MMVTCVEFSQHLSEYAADPETLPESLRVRLDAHVDACGHCQRLLDDVSARLYRDLFEQYVRFPLPISGFSFRRENEQGFKEYKHNATDIVFVLVPGGTFSMGGSQEEHRLAREQSPVPSDRLGHLLRTETPIREVTNRSFLIAKFAVSQSEWQNVMGTEPSAFKGGNRPVERVSWRDCRQFCSETGLDFPTEVQWEYACRGGRSTAFAFGNAVSPDQVAFDRRETVPVDAFEPNVLGLFNMHGNTWEWVSDHYQYSYVSTDRSSSGSLGRTIRGGCYLFDQFGCRSATRGRDTEDYATSLNGFRPALTL